MKIARVLASMLAIACCVPAIATEEPSYTLVEKEGSIEIRDYSAIIIAETVVREDFDDAGNTAFRPLFRYIGGDNRDGRKIAMTAPVLQRGADSGGFSVGFITPSQYSLQTAPEPDNPAVKLRQFPAQRMAVLRYSGRWTEANFRKHEALLMGWLKARNLTTTGPSIYARYNAPFVPWPLRRNEVMFPVQAH